MLKTWLSQIRYAFALVLMFTFSLNVQAKWEEASAVIETSTQDMLKILEQEELLLEEQQDTLLAELDTALSPVVDFDYISKVVMGKYYRRASAEERAAFSDVFKTTLLKTYAKALVGFKIEKFEIVPPKKNSPSPKKQIVSVNVYAGDGTKYALVYYMRKGDEGWRLVNALLDGINLRLTFKNQFADMVQKNRGDVGAVIANWKEKVDPGKSEA
ncbi:MAG: MlaC/ttg2D family ABC transporter substrate-binding protein [Neptuniibacter sp.]